MSLLDKLSHDILIQIFGLLPLPCLCRCALVDRTCSVASGALIHGRSSWATIGGVHSTATEVGEEGGAAYYSDFAGALKRAVQTTLLGQPALGFIFSTRLGRDNQKVQGRRRSSSAGGSFHETLDRGGAAEQYNSQGARGLISLLPVGATIIGAGVQEITSVLHGPDSQTEKTNVFDSNAMSGKDVYTMSLASLPPNSRTTPFYLSHEMLHQSANSSQPDFTALLEEMLIRPYWHIHEGSRNLNSHSGPKYSTIVIIAAGEASSTVNSVVKWLQIHFPATKIVGGLTTSGLLFAHGGSTHVYETHAGILGVAICGDASFESEVSRACFPVTGVLNVESCAGQNIQTLSERGSSAAPEKAVNVLGRSMSAQGRNSRMFFCGLSDNLNMGFELCQIRGMHPNGSIVVEGDTSGKPYVQLFGLDAESSSKDIVERIGHAVNRNMHKQALGALLFTCGGRGERLYNRVGVEAEIFEKLIPGRGLSGFYGMGEIGPCALIGGSPENSDDSDLQNLREDGIDAAPSCQPNPTAEIMGFTAVFGIFFAPSFSATNIGEGAWQYPGRHLAAVAAEHKSMEIYAQELMEFIAQTVKEAAGVGERA